MNISPPADRAVSLRERLLGDWRLVSLEQLVAGVRGAGPLGASPCGSLHYGRDGRMSARLDPGADAPAVTDRSGIFARGLGYAGRYEIDAACALARHHLEQCSHAPWIGTVFERHVAFAAEHLVLSTPSALVRGRDTVVVAVWARAP